jgi:Fibronectin type III domain
MENIVHRNGICLMAVLSIVVFGLPLSLLAAKNVTLAWNPSEQTNVVGYSVYYGTASHRYTEKLSVPIRKAVISDLVENKTYYFAVTASNDLGLESSPSDEVIYSVPPAPGGNYHGLFFEPDAIRPGRAGSFAVSVNGRATYTGWLKVGSARYSLSGKLDSQYQGLNSIRLRDGSTLTIQFNLGTGSQAASVNGQVSDGVWVAALSGQRGGFDARNNPAPGRGYYTIVFASAGGVGGHGFGTVNVSAGGTVRFAGSLADGAKVSQSAPLSLDGQWPLYASLYSGRGLAMSRIEFVNKTKSDLDGTLCWIKGPNAAARFYPGGFVDQCEVLGAAYRKAPAFNFTEGSAAFSGGNLGDGFADSVVVGSKSLRNSPGSSRLTMKVSTSKGTFTGKAADPSTGRSWPFKGVILQKANAGFGYLVGTNETSQVLILQRPPPAPTMPPD